MLSIIDKNITNLMINDNPKQIESWSVEIACDVTFIDEDVIKEPYVEFSYNKDTLRFNIDRYTLVIEGDTVLLNVFTDSKTEKKIIDFCS